MGFMNQETADRLNGYLMCLDDTSTRYETFLSVSLAFLSSHGYCTKGANLPGSFVGCKGSMSFSLYNEKGGDYTDYELSIEYSDYHNCGLSVSCRIIKVLCLNGDNND